MWPSVLGLVAEALQFFKAHQDRVMISLARRLPEGYVVLTRTMPTALAPAARMQAEFVANLIYYGCDELPAEGIAQVAQR